MQIAETAAHRADRMKGGIEQFPYSLHPSTSDMPRDFWGVDRVDAAGIGSAK